MEEEKFSEERSSNLFCQQYNYSRNYELGSCSVDSKQVV